MNNFLTRTLSGFLFVALIIGSILFSQYTFAGLFAIVTGWAVREFHQLSNKQKDTNVNLSLGLIGGVL
jgi:phosphatidate cytidylyltransferase